MGSNSKKTKESRKRRHRSRSQSLDEKETVREKKHRHHRKHKERRREKHKQEYESDDSDVVEVIEESRLSPPPAPEISGGGSSESLSIKETNKLRAKLGLKPLQVQDNKSRTDDGKKKDDLGEFYHKPAHSLTQKNQQEKIRSKLVDHREKRNFESKLSKVKLLANEDNDDDAVAWIEKTRRIQNAKKEAQRRAKALEELDAQFGVGAIVEAEHRLKRNRQYNEKNLKGLRVDHDIEAFGESSMILTLQDRDILEEGDDVLINVNLRENERYKKSNENKKRKGIADDEELDEFGNLQSKSLLGKYDEEIDGEKRDSFQIGLDNALARKQAMLQSIKNKLANKIVEDLSTTKLTIASDYYNEEEMSKFKKPKKKVRKMRIKGKLSSTETSDGTESKRVKVKEHLDYDDVPAMNPKIEMKMEDEVDDSLERALQKSRKLKQKQIIINTLPIADIIKSEPPPEESVELGNIVLNSTAEFCRTLGDIPTYGKSGNREDSENLLEMEKEEEDDDDDVEIIEDDDIDEGGKWNAVDPNRIVREATRVTIVETPILDEEPDVGSGVGAALKLAMSKGYLDKEDSNRPSNSRLAHLQAQHYSIEDKTYGDETERGGAGGGNRRERYAGPITDFKEKEMFKPNVKLEYIDDDGHVLCAKEAFRYLSHKFHGKGPGKNKVEKRLKKSQQEGLMKKMSSTDTPLGTLNMLQSKQKEMQSPYIVLSGGKHTHSTTIAKARR